jgi:hypothetical protein
LRGNFGPGLKEGIEGTQFEDQIGAAEFLETLRQASTKRNGLIFWIPFHNHETEEEIGEDKKSPYLIYLLWSCLTQRQSVLVIIF